MLITITPRLPGPQGKGLERSLIISHCPSAPSRYRVSIHNPRLYRFLAGDMTNAVMRIPLELGAVFADSYSDAVVNQTNRQNYSTLRLVMSSEVVRDVSIDLASS
jgi:hypothetical protein